MVNQSHENIHIQRCLLYFLDGIYNNERSRTTSTKGDWKNPCELNEVTKNSSSSPHYIYLNDDLSVNAETWIKLKPGFKQYNTPEEYLNFTIK